MGADPTSIFPDGMFPESMFPENFFPGDAGPDETPDAFAFSNVTGAALSEQRTSNTITVSGLGDGVSVDVIVAGAAQYSKNGGAYGSSAGSAVNGDTFTLRMNASASYSANVSGTLTIGTLVRSWTVRTMSDPAAEGEYAFVEDTAFAGFIQ